MIMASCYIEQASLRTQILQQRSALSLSYQEYRAPLIIKKLLTRCMQVKTIGFYYPINQEVDTRELWKICHDLGIQTYLPILSEDRTLLFAQFDTDTIFIRGQYDIPIPKTPQVWSDPQDLDLVIVPLLACDSQGQRLGMGGGFYDKTFAFKQNMSLHSSPVLLGVGWDFQLISDHFIVSNDWDIPLSGFISESFDLVFGSM